VCTQAVTVDLWYLRSLLGPHCLFMFSISLLRAPYVVVFFFNAPPTTVIYTLSLHDALPICSGSRARPSSSARCRARRGSPCSPSDRKSTRLNSSHQIISYAVFCLKKKNSQTQYNNLNSDENTQTYFTMNTKTKRHNEMQQRA